jgi:uncharacterized protein YkwD
MHAQQSPPRTGWRRFLTPTVVRVLAALGVVAAAAVIVPTLTSEPTHDADAVETAGRTSTTVDLGVTTDDVALELPSELTTVPPTDVTRPTTAATKAGGKATSTTAKATGGSGSTTPTSQATSSTTQTTAATTTTTTPPSSGCSYAADGAAEARIAELFSARRPDMQRSSSMDATARSWACEMAGRQTAVHMEPFVPNRTNQIFAACGGCAAVAENVAFNSTADGAWSSWLNSETHLRNINQAGAGSFGIGVYRNGANLYFVHVFGHQG